MNVNSLLQTLSIVTVSTAFLTGCTREPSQKAPPPTPETTDDTVENAVESAVDNPVEGAVESAAEGVVEGGLSLTLSEPQGAPEIPVLGQLPDFKLKQQDGMPFGSAQLRGKVWVAGFVSTRCTANCPAKTGRFVELQKTFRNYPGQEAIRLVTITPDPHDTPEALREYARQARADLSSWAFLTGDPKEIEKLYKNGFKLPKLPVPDTKDDSGSPLAHSLKFVLIDRRGAIRGYYNGLEQEPIQRLRRDLQYLLNDPASDTLHLGHPQEVIDPPWLHERRATQLGNVNKFEVFYDFQFNDLLPESGIRFQHRIVDDAGKHFRGNHYQHGNGIAIADVDGDGLYDIYFTSQLGRNELWKNVGSRNFEDITESANVELADRISVSASFADIDNDGDADLYVTTVRGGNALLENDGKGKFTDISKTSGLDYVGHSSGAVFFDFDRDRLLDLFLVNVGVYTTDVKGPGGYYVGFTDAFAGHLKPERSEPSILFKNVGDNRFVDVSSQTGLVDPGWAGDATPLDLNEDGWMDLYLLNMQGHDEYYENVAGERFVRKSRQVFPKTPWGSMGAKVFDYNNDGHLDIFVTDMHTDMIDSVLRVQRPWQQEREKMQEHYPPAFLNTDQNHVNGNAFFRNEGGGGFAEISDRIGAESYWPWGLSVGDINADGFEDVFITASRSYPFRYQVNSVLLNNRGKEFLDSEFILWVEPRRDMRTAKSWFELDCSGADKPHTLCQGQGDRQVICWAALGSRSSVIFDVDEDGDLDIVTNEFNSEPMLLISNLTSAKPDVRFLKVELVGTRSNKNALGAKVRVRAGGQTYVKVQDGQSGYLSQSLYPLYFGLGDADHVDQIEILWPSGEEQLVEGPIETNQLQTITEL